MKKYLLATAFVFMSGSVWAEGNTNIIGGDCSKTTDDHCSWSLNTTTGELIISGTGEMADYEGKTIDGKQEYGYYYTSGKTSYSSAPWGTYQVNSITIENGIENIGYYAFAGTNISTIDFPPSVTSLGQYSFFGSKIQSVEIPETITSFSGGEFEKCFELAEVVLPENMTTIPVWMFGQSGLEDVDIPDMVGSIHAGAFTQTKIESLVIPESVTKISKMIFTDGSGGGTAPYLQHLYCTAVQMEKCEEALQTAKKDFKPTHYEKSGNDYLVYDEKGNVVGKYASAMNLNKGVATETYKYDSAGHLVSIFDGNGQRTWGKKIYTVEEANKVAKPTGNTFRIRYR